MILQICLNFFGFGAVMRRARGEVRALLNAGHKVIIFTDLRNKKYLYSFKKFHSNLKIIHVPLISIPGPMHNIIQELSFSLFVYFRLKKLIKKNLIDIIICHTTTACYGVARIANKRRIPSVIVIQGLIRDRLASGNPYNWWTTQLYIHSNRYALSKMNYSIAVSNYMKSLAIIEGAPPENVIISHNFVDTQIFHPNNKIIKNIDVLFIGRLSIEKGVGLLIDATRYLAKDRQILIIGDGPLRHRLEWQARHSKCVIKFQGWVRHDILPYYIQRARLLVAPSLSEAHAAVPLEAMACGVPVIGSQVGGMEDTIDHEKNGWLLKKKANSKDLGKLLEIILSNNEKLKVISQAALKKAEFFSLKKFDFTIGKLYETLIKDINCSLKQLPKKNG